MTPALVRERLRLFREVEAERGPEAGMWAVLQEERNRRRQRGEVEVYNPVAEAVISATCGEFELTPVELLATCPPRPTPEGRRRLHARWVAMRVMREEGLSLKAIAFHLQRAGHGTVMHGLSRVKGDKQLQNWAALVLAAVRGSR